MIASSICVKYFSRTFADMALRTLRELADASINRLITTTANRAKTIAGRASERSERGIDAGVVVFHDHSIGFIVADRKGILPIPRV